jgi:hypothetical protein
MPNKSLIKIFIAFLATLLLSGTAFAQLSGVKYIDNTGSGDYISFTLAITDLNTQGVGSGGVIFRVLTGQTFNENPPPITATGTSTDPITFVKWGAGANPIIIPSVAGTLTVASAGGNGDVIIKIVGGDYITFDGIDVQDNAGFSGAGPCFDYGYMLVKVNGTDACKYVVIRNSNITLKKTTQYSCGLGILNIDNTGSAVTVTTTGGRCEYISIYSNNITNSYEGIYHAGYADAVTDSFKLYDQNIEIGIGGGNTITNFGGAALPVYGIYSIYANNLKINNNFIHGGTGTTATIYSIYSGTSYHTNVDICYNDIQDSSSATTGSIYGIYNYGGQYYSTAAPLQNTVNLKGNNIHDFYFSLATSGYIYALYDYSYYCKTLYVDSNTVCNMTFPGTGYFYGLYCPYDSIIYFRWNKVYNIVKTGASGYMYLTYPYYTGYQQATFAYNEIHDCGGTASSFSGYIYGLYAYSYYAYTLGTCYNNQVYNLYTGTGYVYALYHYPYYSTNASCHDNYVNNIRDSTGTVYGLFFNNYYSPTANCYNNQVRNIKGKGIATIYAAYLYGPGSGTFNIYNNTIDSIQSKGTVYGMYQYYGNPVNVYNNKITNLQVDSTYYYCYGMYLYYNTTSNIYNNMIANLNAPRCTLNYLATNAPCIQGISIVSTGIWNLYYNSVYLNAVTSRNYQSSAALYASTTPTVNLRNNVFKNTSTPGVLGGFTVAYWRTNTTLTTYASTSDNNCFYAGTPGARNLIFRDFTNSDQTLAQYKARVTPRDANSVTEDVPFISATNLHINTAIPTRLESGAQPITGITTDIDGDLRVATKIHSNVHPDIGADEFNGIPIDEIGPVITYTPLPYTNSTSNRTLTATIVDVVSGVTIEDGKKPTLFYKKNSGGTWYQDSLIASPWTFTVTVSNMGGVAIGDTVFYYVQAYDSSGNVTVNPSTAPTTPNFYVITSTPLAGNYTVGISAFNRLTHHNIYFERAVRKVMREVQVPKPTEPNLITDKKNANNNYKDATALAFETKWIEVEEVSWVPMENGKPYTGDLYVKKSENPQLDFPAGVDGDYATITAAVADLNLRGVKGWVNFLLIDATYPSETYPITVNVVNESVPTASKLVTIKPNTGITATVSGASASSQIFRILSSYITIDGSNSGTSSRNLTIQNTSVTTPQVIAIAPNTTTPTTNVTVKNCIIINGVNSSTAVVVGNLGYFNNITLQNNSVQLAYIGIYVNATLATGNGSCLITGNDLNTAGANAVRMVGVYVQGADGAMVTNNNIGKFAIADAANVTGIWFATGTVNSTIAGNTIDSLDGLSTSPPRGIAISTGVAPSNLTISGNSISRIWTAYSSPPYGIYVFSTTTGVVIEKNRLSDMHNSNTGGYGMRAMYINTGVASSNIIIRNNFLWNIWATADASTTYWGIGICIEGTTGAVGVYYNSVNLYGSYAGYSSATVHAAFAVLTATTGLDVRDNIFVNTFDNTNSATDKSYAINSQAANTAFTDINYNDYYVAGTPGVLGYLGADQPTLAAWRIATGKDVNSISADPLFTNPTNLHIPTTVNSPVNRAATPIGGITNDIDNDTRNASRPDIGADEYTPNAPGTPILTNPANGATMQPLAGQLNWLKSDYATNYDVFLDVNNPPTVKVGTFQTDTFYNYAGLNPNTEYYWKVTAWNDTLPLLVQGVSSEIDSFKTYAPPLSPTGLTLTNVKADSMHLAWNDNSSDEIGFYIRRDISSGGSFPIIDSVGTGVTNYDAFGLSGNTHYWFRVSAFKYFGLLTLESGFSQKDTWTLAQTPGAPTFSNVGYKSMTVYLTPLTNPATTQFVVRVTYAGPTIRYLDPTTGTLVVSEVWGTYTQFGGASGKVVTGLNYNTQYTFETKARNGANPPAETPYGPAGIQSTLEAISTFPYYQDFEYTDKGTDNLSKDKIQPTDVADPNYWTTGIFSGTANDWVRGTPTPGGKVQILGPHSGSKCWVTGLTGYYQNSENAYVLSPAFDFSAYTNPAYPLILSFYHNFYCETGWEGCIVEYTTDDVNWTKLDTTTPKSTNWYNNNSTSGPIPPMKWSGTSTVFTNVNGWAQSSHYLDMLCGQPFVRFRFRFGSDGSVNSYDGWAFDDVSIDFFTDASVTAIARPNPIEQKRISFQPQVTVTNSSSNALTIPAVAEIWKPQSGIEESFDGTTFPPTGWLQQIIVSGGTNWTRVTSGTYPTCSPHSGAGMAEYNSFGASSGCNARLITSELYLATDQDLDFYMMHDNGYSGNPDTMIIEITTDGGTSWNRLGAFLRYENISVPTWELHTLALNSYTGNNVKIAFHAWSGYGNNMFIDDVTVGTYTPPELLYVDTVDVTNVPGQGGTGTATFTSYTPDQEGDLQFKSYTILSGDMSPANNLMTLNFTVELFPLTLVSPASGTLTNDNTPTFNWSSVTAATSYRIQVDNNSDFSSPEFDQTTSNTSITSSVLPDDIYYWHVRVEAPGTPDPYSLDWTLEIDATGPGAPTLVNPTPNQSGVDTIPNFAWNTVPPIKLDTKIEISELMATDAIKTNPGTDLAVNTHLQPGTLEKASEAPLVKDFDNSAIDFYTLQLDTLSDFSSLPLIIDATIYAPTTNYLSPLTLSEGKRYYWRVNATDLATNPGQWATDSFVTLALFPIFTVNPTLLAFGNVNVGLNKQDSVTVTNNGLANLIISTVTAPAEFSVTPTSYTLVPSESKKFYVTFAPTSGGLKSGNVVFTHNATGSPTNVPVTGTGVSASTVWVPKTNILTQPSGKNPKYGSCLAGLNGEVYFLKASNKPDFAKFTPNATTGTWTVLDTFGKGLKTAGDGKYPKKGASMAAYSRDIYALRGNNTPGFWKFHADTTGGDTQKMIWKKLTNITTGTKNPKDASGMVAVTRTTVAGDSDYIFTMKGSKTNEFYFYNIATNSWSAALTAPPAGLSGKTGFKKGSCLAYDAMTKNVYVMRGQYGDFYKYNVDSLTWKQLKRYDFKTIRNRDGKKKKFGDGAAMVCYDDAVYVLKGGNTFEFWKYQLVPDSGWTQMNPGANWDIPTGGGKKVKSGGGMTMLPGGLYAGFYAAKGGNTAEFFYHGLPADFLVTLKTTNDDKPEGAMANNIATDNFRLTIAPNPAINHTAINYTLPKAGTVSFKLYDVTGMVVRTYTNTNPTKDGALLIDTKALPSGVYVLRFNAGEINVTRKLVLEK